MTNWEKTQAERAVDLVFGPPPDKCNIALIPPLWAPIQPLEGCDCLACQRRRKSDPDVPVVRLEVYVGLRNGLLMTAGILAIVWLAFKLGLWL